MSGIKLAEVIRKIHGEEEEDVDRLHVAVEMTSSAKDDTTKRNEFGDIMRLFHEGRAYNTWRQLSEIGRKDLTIVESALRRTRVSA